MNDNTNKEYKVSKPISDKIFSVVVFVFLLFFVIITL